MQVIRLALATALLAALAVVAPASAATPRLIATVGPGFTITLKTAAGKRVTTLKRGRYTFVVRDRSEDHNFHLKGPVNRNLSGVDFVGTKRVTVTLKAGRYTYLCDPHADSMRSSFRVR